MHIRTTKQFGSALRKVPGLKSVATFHIMRKKWKRWAGVRGESKRNTQFYKNKQTSKT